MRFDRSDGLPAHGQEIRYIIPVDVHVKTRLRLDFIDPFRITPSKKFKALFDAVFSGSYMADKKKAHLVLLALYK